MTTPAQMNKDRADRVRQALTAVYESDDRDALVNLLTDIRHLCDDMDVNYYDLTETAYGHYLEEHNEAIPLRA